MKNKETNQSGTVRGEGSKRDFTGLFIKGEQPKVHPTGGGQSLASNGNHRAVGVHGHEWASINTPTIRGTVGNQRK